MRKWKCVELNGTSGFTVGNIYTTDDEGNNLNYDDGTESVSGICNGIAWNAKFEEVTQFAKSDIKPCMIVQIRDGRLCMIIDKGNKNLNLNLLENLNYGVVSFNDYNGLDYQDREADMYDIVNIYGFSPHANGTLSIKDRPLLWSRNQTEIKQLEKQKSEIEAKLKQLKGE